MTTLELPSRYRDLYRDSMSVAEYHALIENGTLTPDDRVELIRGQLVLKMPQNTPHSSTILRLNRLLHSLLPTGWQIGMQIPVALADSEPEPDLCALRHVTDHDYDVERPRAGDCTLAIEVSDSSLRHDRTAKLELYAEAMIPIYWIVNIPDRLIEVYRDPNPSGEYLGKTLYRDGESAPVVLDGLQVGTLAVSDILPRAGA